MKQLKDNSNAQYLTNNGETILSQDLINACRTSAEVIFHQNRKSVRTLDLEDFFQDVYEKALRGISGFDPRMASLKTWVSRIAWHSLLDVIDRGKRRTSMLAPSLLDFNDRDGDDIPREKRRMSRFVSYTAINKEDDEFIAPEIDGYRGDEYEADRELLTSEAISAIEAACGKLCKSHRVVLDLAEKGYKPGEIATITGWTPAKVYGALCWARKNLGAYLGKDFLRENGIAA